MQGQLSPQPILPKNDEATVADRAQVASPEKGKGRQEGGERKPSPALGKEEGLGTSPAWVVYWTRQEQLSDLRGEVRDTPQMFAHLLENQ